jgi:hypothetical protein
VVRQQRRVRGERTGVGALVPLGDRPVQLPPLRPQHQAVGGLLGDDVLEQVGQVGLGGIQGRQVGRLQRHQVVQEDGGCLLHGVDVAQHAQGEHPPDHACHLQGELLGWREPVDPAGDHPVHCVRQLQAAEVAHPGRELAASVDQPDQAGVP